jgi:hypothetical protein
MHFFVFGKTAFGSDQLRNLLKTNTLRLPTTNPPPADKLPTC